MLLVQQENQFPNNVSRRTHEPVLAGSVVKTESKVVPFGKVATTKQLIVPSPLSAGGFWESQKLVRLAKSENRKSQINGNERLDRKDYVGYMYGSKRVNVNVTDIRYKKLTLHISRSLNQ